MATKTAKKKTTTKAAPAKKSAKKTLPVGLYQERNPEAHKATGKYKFFYVLFAFTTILFACLSVYFFIFASEILNKYEEIEVCARNNRTCSITVDGTTEE